MSKRKKQHSTINIKEKHIKRYSSYNPIFTDSGGGWSGAGNTRPFKYWDYVSGLADSEILSDLPELRARSRDLYRNNPYGRAPIQTITTNVVGSGIFLQAAMDRKELFFMQELTINDLEDTTEKKFQNWAESKNCDASRQSCFYDIQNLAFLSYCHTGEIFCTLPILKRDGKNQLCLQLIEADLIQNGLGQFNSRTCKDGIEQNEYGEPIKYTIRISDFEWKTVSAYGEKTGRPNIIHFFRQERPGQSRGIPLLSSVIEVIKQIDRYSKNTLIQTIVQNLFSVFIKSNNVDALNNIIPGTDTIPTSTSELDDDCFDLKLAPGSVHRLADGEDISFANPTSPQQQFSAFIDAHLRAIGMATNLPFEVLKKEFNTNYSASRAARLEAWRFFLMEREKFNRDFNQIIYKEWFTIEILEGRINAPNFFEYINAYTKCSWLGSTMGQVDETKEVEAAVLRMENNLSTHTEETRKLTGYDFKQNMDIKRREREIMGDLQPQPQIKKDEITAKWLLNNFPNIEYEIKNYKRSLSNVE